MVREKYFGVWRSTARRPHTPTGFARGVLRDERRQSAFSMRRPNHHAMKLEDNGDADDVSGFGNESG
jgi:hypothetical protein